MFKFLSLCHIVTLLMEIPACSSLSLPYLLLYIPDSQTFSLCTLILTRWWIFSAPALLYFSGPVEAGAVSCSQAAQCLGPAKAFWSSGRGKRWFQLGASPPNVGFWHLWLGGRQVRDSRIDPGGWTQKLPRLDANKACGIREGAWTIDAAGRGSRVGCRGRDTWRILSMPHWPLCAGCWAAWWLPDMVPSMQRSFACLQEHSESQRFRPGSPVGRCHSSWCRRHSWFEMWRWGVPLCKSCVFAIWRHLGETQIGASGPGWPWLTVPMGCENAPHQWRSSGYDVFGPFFEAVLRVFWWWIRQAADSSLQWWTQVWGIRHPVNGSHWTSSTKSCSWSCGPWCRFGGRAASCQEKKWLAQEGLGCWDRQEPQAREGQAKSRNRAKTQGSEKTNKANPFKKVASRRARSRWFRRSSRRRRWRPRWAWLLRGHAPYYREGVGWSSGGRPAASFFQLKFFEFAWSGPSTCSRSTCSRSTHSTTCRGVYTAVERFFRVLLSAQGWEREGNPLGCPTQHVEFYSITLALDSLDSRALYFFTLPLIL